MGETISAELQSEKGAFFRILATTRRTQTATMTIPPGDEAGPPETHQDSDQIFYIIEGEAELKVWEVGPEEAPLTRRAVAGTVLVVPAGTRHWVKSTGKVPLFFLTVYGPPEY